MVEKSRNEHLATLEREQELDDMAPIQFDDSMLGRLDVMKSMARRDVENSRDFDTN